MIMLQANGQNIITSTHDQVVNIIVKSGKKLHLKVVTPTVKPAGLSKAQDSPRTVKKQQTVSSPVQKAPQKPVAPPQVTKGGLPNDTHKSSVPRKPPPPPQLEQNNDSIKSPPAASVQINMHQNTAVKHKLTKANTIDEYTSSKQQTAKLTRQLSEEPVRPPSQFAAPTKTYEESSRNSIESEDLSPFAIAVKKASQEREQRISTNQPRMSATVKNETITEEKESTPPTVIQQGNNPITSPLAKIANKAINDDKESSSNLEQADSSDFSTSTQKTEAKEKLPISKLIKRFSGEDFPALEDETTQLAPTKVEKTATNFDQQQLSKVSNSSSELPSMMKKNLSSTKTNKTFEGEKTEDGTYNWRNILRTVPKSATISKDTTPHTGEEFVPSEQITSNSSVPEKATNRQIQGSPITTKTSKTSLLAKKFERNSIIKAENMIPPKITDEESKNTVTGSSGSITKHQQEDTGPITIHASSPVLPKVPNESDSQGTTSPLETASTCSSPKTEEQPLRRQSALVMVEETDFSKFPNQYRSSFSVDSDYWNSPEHTALLSVSENTTNTDDESVENEVFPPPLDLPELDLLPPPMLSDDEDLSVAIEDLPPPDTLLPPEIGFLDQLHNLPPPLDLPDTDILPAPDNMFDMNISDLPSPSQLPPPMEDFSDGEISFSGPIPEPVSNQLELPLTEPKPNAVLDDYDGLSHEVQDIITPPEMLPPPAPLSDSELENLPTDMITNDIPSVTEPLYKDNDADGTILPPPEITSLNTSNLPPPMTEDQHETETISEVPLADNQLKPQDENTVQVIHTFHQIAKQWHI